MSYKFLGNVIISGKIKCLTGLYIGGTEEGYEIGGVDSQVIKEHFSGYPYIPGSSLKGKIRSIMEWTEENKIRQDGKTHYCTDDNCFICRVFGSSAAVSGNRKSGPTRLIVRDAFVDEKTIKKMEEIAEETGLLVEVKTENSINRITSEAVPRSKERVAKDSCFDFQFIYGIYDINDDKGTTDINHLNKLFEAMRLLEDSALGGGGSRGSGRIEFALAEDVNLKTLNEYEEGREFGVSQKFVPLKEFKVAEFIGRVTQKLNGQKAN